MRQGIYRVFAIVGISLPEKIELGRHPGLGIYLKVLTWSTQLAVSFEQAWPAVLFSLVSRLSDTLHLMFS